jgi:hypothetical protein
LVEQISEATNGPLKYRGPDMKTVHKDMGITDAQFNAAAADLKKALELNLVADADVQAILSAVNTYRKDIVQPKKGDEKKQDGKKTEDKNPAEKKSTDKKSANQASMSGKVTYKGLPLSGGTITFVGKEKSNTYKANLTADGTFEVSSLKPGEYKVAIETETVRPAKGAKEKTPVPENAAKGSKPAGSYVKIPVKYGTVNTSPLTLTIKVGSQVHNFDLSD